MSEGKVKKDLEHTRKLIAKKFKQSFGERIKRNSSSSISETAEISRAIDQCGDDDYDAQTNRNGNCVDVAGEFDDDEGGTKLAVVEDMREAKGASKINSKSSSESIGKSSGKRNSKSSSKKESAEFVANAEPKYAHLPMKRKRYIIRSPQTNDIKVTQSWIPPPPPPQPEKRAKKLSDKLAAKSFDANKLCERLRFLVSTKKGELHQQQHIQEIDSILRKLYENGVIL